MHLKDIQERAYKNGAAKEFYDPTKPPVIEDLPKYLMYISSEIGEIFEDWRHGKAIVEWHYDENGKPQGIPTEFADIVIWIGSLSGYYGIDLEEIVKAKMDFNATRPAHHGNARA